MTVEGAINASNLSFAGNISAHQVIGFVSLITVSFLTLGVNVVFLLSINSNLYLPHILPQTRCMVTSLVFNELVEVVLVTVLGSLATLIGFLPYGESFCGIQISHISCIFSWLLAFVIYSLTSLPFVTGRDVIVNPNGPSYCDATYYFRFVPMIAACIRYFPAALFSLYIFGTIFNIGRRKKLGSKELKSDVTKFLQDGKLCPPVSSM
ncbi:uncharacterized protein LOC136024631 isoform X2 [Artemia franciscana]|uniref:uncharacterized protein LOC136024631 isoform X2 n=1 Tax=Artemia franciscana TaxID=6661 RepID=UPI0032DACC88